MRKFYSTLAIALSVATPSLAQEITPAETPEWVKSLGSFIRAGVAPPRTAADLAREEEEQRTRELLQPEPTPEPVIEAKPAPAPIEQPVPAAVAAPQPPARPGTADPAPVVLTMPKPRPLTVVPVIQPPPAPVAPSDRIAGTATLDQALKLGGSKDLYGQRVRRSKAE